MARELTEIEIKVVDGATKALNSIAASAKAGKTTFTELSSAVTLVENALGKIAGVANFAVDLLQPARDAETAIARIGVATNATAAELETLRAKSNEVAFQLRIPFDQVAAGAERLAREGASATEVVANIGPVAAFAKAALIETKDAAGQLSDVLDTFGLGIAEIGTVGDTIIATAAAAGTSATALTEAIAKVGPAASLAGLSVNQTAAYLGALAEKGIEGGRAAKQLETIFLQLQDPTSKAGEVIRSLGLDVNNLGPVFDRLATDSTAAEAVLASLGDKPRVALKALLAEGGGAVKELTEIINGSAGASAEAADKLGSTFDGAVQRLLGSLSEVSAAFFNPILAPFAAEIDAVSARIRAFAETQDFKNIQAQVLNFVTTAVAKLKEFASSFDFSAAVESVRRFVAVATASLGLIAETVNNARIEFNKFLVVINAIEFTIDKLVQIQAELASSLVKTAESFGLSNDTSKEFANILDDVAESAAREAEVNKNDLSASLDIVTGAAKNATPAVQELATAHQAAATAAKEQASAQQALAAQLPPVAAAVDDISGRFKALASDAKEGGKQMQKAVEAPSGSIDELRNRLIILNQALVKAFKEGGNTKQLRDEIKATEAQVTALAAAADKAAEGTKKLGESAEIAAPKIAKVGTESSKTANDAAKLDTAASSAADSVKKTGDNATAAAADIGEVSDEFARLAAATNLLYNDQGLRLKSQLEDQREAALRRQAQIREEIASLDPLEQAVKRVNQQYKFIGQGQARALAEQELRLQQLRQQGQGGASAGGNGSNADATTRSGGININLALSALDPAALSNDTIKDLARRLAAPIRTFIQSGA